MNTKNLIVGDYKKWLLYSFDGQDFNDHYHLFKALKNTSDAGNIRLNRSTEADKSSIIVSHDQVLTIFKSRNIKKHR